MALIQRRLGLSGISLDEIRLVLNRVGLLPDKARLVWINL